MSTLKRRFGPDEAWFRQGGKKISWQASTAKKKKSPPEKEDKKPKKV